MQLTPEEGILAGSPEESSLLDEAGYKGCYTPECNYHLKPDTEQSVLGKSGYYTCPRCNRSYDLQEHLPWHGAPEDTGHFPEGRSGGGGTAIGLNMSDQGQIGEDLIMDQKALPGYGPILWWHEGGAAAPSPLDGATRDWGIEVKTIGYDARHHRFIAGRPEEREAKNNAAAEMGLKGILGILVLLDYRRSVADIYAKEMPLSPWESGTGTYRGVANFRKNTAMHLLEELPFQNPFMDPSHPAPHSPQEREEIPF